jgi:hypothetical protein
MSEQAKEPRKLAEIQQDYHNTCARAGHLRYQIEGLGKDLDLVLSTLRDLNFEAVAQQQAEKDKKVEAATEKAPLVQKEEGNS